MERPDEAAIVAQIEDLRRDLAGRDAADSAGEVVHLDQHQADAATETHDRERALGRILELEDLLRRLRAGGGAPAGGPVGPPPDPDDVSTPLDEPAPAEDLSAIPMAEEPADVVADPQERTDEPDMDMPGRVYREGGPPDVGRPDPGDRALRDYRPD